MSARCPECMSLDGHGLVHERHPQGGGGVNRMCSRAVRTWADGFGVWHARAATAFDAWWAIRGELLARDEATPLAMRNRMKVREVETGVYAEWWPERDGQADA